MTLLFAAAVFTVSANAQVSVSINIGTQPIWGPTGYDHVDYYYLPDAGIYYDVPNKVYVYPNGKSWARSATLPSRYSNVDLYRTHKVVINGVDRPYNNNAKYQKQYAGFKGKFDQTPIRDAKEDKYFENKQHPQHAQWEKNHPGNGPGKGGPGNGPGPKKH